MAGRETCSVARVNVFNQRNLISRLVFLLASLSHSLTAVAVVHSFVVQRAAPSYQWPGASVGLEQPTTANRGRQGLKKKKNGRPPLHFGGFLPDYRSPSIWLRCHWPARSTL